MKNLEFLPCGDTAISVQLGLEIDRATCLKILSLKAVIEKATIPGVIEMVPSYRSLIVHYNPLQVRQHKLIQQIQEISDSPEKVAFTPKQWRVPVCFDPEFGWDIIEVSETVDKPVDLLIEDFTSTHFFVYMLGFFMGHLYMGDLPDYMKVLSRKQNPRVRVDAGAVCTAQGLSIVHSIAAPGGWNVLGRTPVPLFDLRNNPAATFTAGDQINFFAVEKKEFQDIQDRVTANEYRPEFDEVKI